MYLEPQFDQMQNILKSVPSAYAMVKGGPGFPNINGMVCFYQLADGVLVLTQINGLPHSTGSCPADIFGFHIHEGNQCTGNAQDPFANAGAHYNPNHCPHPAHAGDMPPLFGNHGFAFMAFMTDRFSVNEIIGRTVIVHSSPDDFKTQPSGNSGNKIACGQIVRNSME
ncbi:superoxide dismutase family protein [Caproiciproducens sp. R1]|uniref:superoxide dismutase family protein n=1 Tax=Caproiciproducens sp. R1 TaxID=3435000 RepID=UPI0040334957